VLHGALGAGNNFRSIARALVAERPETEFVLVDLRLHGRSLDAPRPHSLRASAEDLNRLAQHLGKLPEVVMGHSFGGKVALAYARQAGPGLEQIWVLDSNPGAQGPEVADPEVVQVLSRLTEVPGPFDSRDAAVQALQELGISAATARWLGGNYERREQGYLLKLDVPALEELLSNYFEDDFWPFLEEPRDSPEVHLVIAERSDRLSPALRRKAESLPAATQTHTHVLGDAGHWLHVDNPAGLVKLVLTHF
jgi:pimeloyl-ACP methyl ester carboxylesterase